MALTKFQTKNPDLSLLQTSWTAQLDPLLANPLSSGIMLTGISLAVGVNVINHRLDRKLQGYIIIGQDARSDLWDSQATNQMPNKTLILNSSNICTVNLYVF